MGCCFNLRLAEENKFARGFNWHVNGNKMPKASESRKVFLARLQASIVAGFFAKALAVMLSQVHSAKIADLRSFLAVSLQAK